jgi:hypothetical protein
MLQRVKTRKWHKSVKIILNGLLCLWAKKLSQTKLVKKNETHYILNKGFTYLLTPWSRVLNEKLNIFKLVKRFLAYYGI